MRRSFLYVLLLLTLWMQGCNIIAGATAVLAPPELVEARYPLPDKPTLVVVDDRQQIVQSPPTLNRVATSIRTTLEAERVITTGFVETNDLNALRAELGPAYATTSLAGLGLALDAKQVIHVEVTGYQIQLIAGVVRPTMQVAVRVFDLDARQRVFPGGMDSESGVDLGQGAYPVTTQLTAQDLSEIEAAQALAARDLADTTGRDVARLFFDWRRPDRGANIGRDRR